MIVMCVLSIYLSIRLVHLTQITATKGRASFQFDHRGNIYRNNQYLIRKQGERFQVQILAEIIFFAISSLLFLKCSLTSLVLI